MVPLHGNSIEKDIIMQCHVIRYAMHRNKIAIKVDANYIQCPFRRREICACGCWLLPSCLPAFRLRVSVRVYRTYLIPYQRPQSERASERSPCRTTARRKRSAGRGLQTALAESDVLGETDEFLWKQTKMTEEMTVQFSIYRVKHKKGS